MVVRRPDPALFRTAVASVLDQSLTDLELIVVETPSEVALRPLLAGLEDHRIGVRTIAPDASLTAARNAAIAAARAPLVAILDADDIAAPERLQRQAAFLDDHPEVAVLGSAILLIAADGAPLGVRRYPTEHEAIARAMRRFNPIAQPAAMVRRDAIEAAGGYAERVGGVCEDYDLWCRMLRTGHRFANLSETLCSYRIHDDSMKSTHLRETLRDTIAIKRAHFGGVLDCGDRLRILGERALCLMPARLVRRLFLRTTLEPVETTT
jgi:glycosyltransferase involved in cell wall biosynthesis